MPYKCCVPLCTGNYGYGNAPQVAVFSFPDDEDMKKKWLKSIPRVNFKPSKFNKVCELHFKKDDIVRELTKFDKKTGKYSTSVLKRLRLKVGAIPIIFPNCPKYLSKTCPPARKSREDKIHEREEANLLQAINESKADFIAHQESITFKNFYRLLEILNLFPQKQNWFTIKDKAKLTFFKIDYNPGPITNYAVVINSSLKMETYLYGQEISLDINQKMKTPCVREKRATLNGSRGAVVFPRRRTPSAAARRIQFSQGSQTERIILCIITHYISIKYCMIVNSCTILPRVIQLYSSLVSLTLKSIENKQIHNYFIVTT